MSNYFNSHSFADYAKQLQKKDSLKIILPQTIFYVIFIELLIYTIEIKIDLGNKGHL